MTNEELHRRTVVALARAAISPMVAEDDLHLLCWHAGVDIDELKGVKVCGYKMKDLPEFVPQQQVAQDLMDRIYEEH